MSTDPISRLAYFSGEALLTTDFQDEQKYHMEMRERLSRGLMTPGILRGLDVEWKYGETQVTVRAGTALDVQGQLIVLTEDTLYGPSLADGKQNFLTISYCEVQSDQTSNSYGEGYKRWRQTPKIDCTPDYDPRGPAILLAVIGASGGVIEGVYYYYGQYIRRRVSTVVQSVEFANADDGVALPAPMSIGTAGQGVLNVEAPQIELNGAVTARSLTAQGTFSGNFSGMFSGTFEGNGEQLSLSSMNYWTRNADGSLFYGGGNVGVNANQPSAVLTVGQPIHAEIGDGLVTAVSVDDGVVTVEGYQTQFTGELVGKILQFGVVLKQKATIASVESDDSLTLDESFPLGLGPTKYGYIKQGGGTADEKPGAGLIKPAGNSVTGTLGTQFQSQAKLQPGDVLVIDRFVPQQKVILSKLASVSTDTALTLTNAFSSNVTNSGYMYSTEPGRWIPGAGTISSTGTSVVGVGTSFTELPSDAALQADMAFDIASAPQTWRVDTVTNTTQLTMHKISIDDGTPLLPMMSSFVTTTWPLMQVGGGTLPSVPPALTAVQNNGSVPNTVAVNVEIGDIQSRYALQVRGDASFQQGSLDIGGDLAIDGNLLVKGSAVIEKSVTAQSDLEVDGDAMFQKTLTVHGAATLKTLEVTEAVADGTGLTVDGLAKIDRLEVTGVAAGGTALTVDGSAKIATLEISDMTETSLLVDGTAHINTLEVTGVNDPGLKVDGSAHVVGTLTVGGGIIGTLKNAGESGFGEWTPTQPSYYPVVAGMSNQNKGMCHVTTYTAQQDGFLMLNTDNGEASDPLGANWYTYRCTIKVGGATFQSDAAGGADPSRMGAPFICANIVAPMKKGSVASIDYNVSGFTSNSGFSIYLYWMPIS